MSKLYLPDTVKKEENVINVKDSLHRLVSRFNKIPDSTLLLSLFIVPLGSAAEYLYYMGCARFYSLSVEYFFESVQIGEWLSQTLISFLFSFLYILFAFKQSEKAVITNKFNSIKLIFILIILLVCVIILFFLKCNKLMLIGLYGLILYGLFVYLFICYGKLFHRDAINLQKKRKICVKINALKAKKHVNKIQFYVHILLIHNI